MDRHSDGTAFTPTFRIGGSYDSAIRLSVFVVAHDRSDLCSGTTLSFTFLPWVQRFSVHFGNELSVNFDESTIHFTVRDALEKLRQQFQFDVSAHFGCSGGTLGRLRQRTTFPKTIRTLRHRTRPQRRRKGTNGKCLRTSIIRFAEFALRGNDHCAQPMELRSHFLALDRWHRSAQHRCFGGHCSHFAFCIRQIRFRRRRIRFLSLLFSHCESSLRTITEFQSLSAVDGRVVGGCTVDGSLSQFAFPPSGSSGLALGPRASAAALRISRRQLPLRFECSDDVRCHGAALFRFFCEAASSDGGVLDIAVAVGGLRSAALSCFPLGTHRPNTSNCKDYFYQFRKRGIKRYFILPIEEI